MFGLLKREGKVYAIPIPNNARASTLLPIIEEKIKPGSIVYTDSFAAYDVLDVSQFHHQRINHSKEFANDDNHINGIENFWRPKPRDIYANSMASQNSTSIFISKSVNGASITVPPKTSSNY